jgi:putative endonuclease
MDTEKQPAVYIAANRYRSTIYTGVTSQLWNRISDHKNEMFEGFTKKHGIKLLVWYEHHHAMEDAIKREKQLKKWNRAWKIKLIEQMNPDWLDLHDNTDVLATLVEPKAGSPLSRG